MQVYFQTDVSSIYCIKGVSFIRYRNVYMCDVKYLVQNVWLFLFLELELFYVHVQFVSVMPYNMSVYVQNFTITFMACLLIVVFMKLPLHEKTCPSNGLAM